MQFGLIIGKEENNIYILAEGDYAELQQLHSLFQDVSENMEAILIPYDQQEYDNIKGRTDLLIESFKGYFSASQPVEDSNESDDDTEDEVVILDK